MSISETLGFGWIVLCVGLFTAQVCIAIGYTLAVGIKTISRWLRWAQEKEAAERDIAAHGFMPPSVSDAESHASATGLAQWRHSQNKEPA